MKEKNMKVSARLGLGFGLLLVTMVVMIAVTLLQLSGIGKINDHVIGEDLVKTNAANTINILTQANGRSIIELLITNDKLHMQDINRQIDANKQSITDALGVLERLIKRPEGKAFLAQIKQLRGQYVASFTRVSKLLEQNKKDDAINLMNTETLPALNALQESVAGLTEFQKSIVVASSNNVKEHIDTARLVLLVLGAAALLVGASAAFLISRNLTSQLGGEPDVIAGIARQIAGGDLAMTITTKADDQASVLMAIMAMRDSLVAIVSQVRVGTETIVTASGQIASGNLDLSARTEQQASALEETASSMEELTSTVKQNTANAREANQLARSASEVAVEGGLVVSKVVSTMREINESSTKIVDIIGVIDGIAFQTNILALNAAVEAARAGEQGRGFAVVASEVRNLAQRSAAAAKEIKALIGDSVEKVGEGAKLVDQAGATMDEVVASVKRVTDIIGEIATAGNEQSAGIEQINQAITQMDDVTQQNAALVEEAAAAAQSMQDQSENLLGVVSVFKLLNGTAPKKAPATARVAASAAQTQAQKMPRNTGAVKKLSGVKPAAPVLASAPEKTAEWEEF